MLLQVSPSVSLFLRLSLVAGTCLLPAYRRPEVPRNWCLSLPRIWCMSTPNPSPLRWVGYKAHVLRWITIVVMCLVIRSQLLSVSQVSITILLHPEINSQLKFTCLWILISGSAFGRSKLPCRNWRAKKKRSKLIERGNTLTLEQMGVRVTNHSCIQKSTCNFWFPRNLITNSLLFPVNWKALPVAESVNIYFVCYMCYILYS